MTPRPVTTGRFAFAGIPVLLDPSLPPDVIEFRHADGRKDRFSFAPSPSTPVVRKDDSDLHQSNANQQGAVSTEEQGAETLETLARLPANAKLFAALAAIARIEPLPDGEDK